MEIGAVRGSATLVDLPQCRPSRIKNPCRRCYGHSAMTELRNRIVQIRRFGDTDGLEVVDVPLPKAGQGEVRVRVLASGLEYTDTLIRRHLYPQTAARRLPFVMGYDLVGEIDQLGNGVSGFQVGDRVADMTVVGSNATYCTLKARELTPGAYGRRRAVHRRMHTGLAQRMPKGHLVGGKYRPTQIFLE